MARARVRQEAARGWITDLRPISVGPSPMPVAGRLLAKGARKLWAMRASRLIAVVLSLGLIAAGGGWSPPSGPPTTSATSTQADAPTAHAVAADTAQPPP